MGTNSSKNRNILQIMENSINNAKKINKDNMKIHYKVNYNDQNNGEENLENDIRSSNNSDSDDPYEYYDEPINIILNNFENPKFDVKNIYKFPYCAIGTIIVQFPLEEKEFKYTCFLISSNVVVTLACNLENRFIGGKATSIRTSFSKENIKWENVYFQKEEKPKVNNNQNQDKNQNEELETLTSKLAVILYDDNISNEWLGVEGGKKEDFEEVEKYVVFSYEKRSDNNNEIDEGEEKDSQTKFREVLIDIYNPFLLFQKNDEFYQKINLIDQSPGSPLYYKDSDFGAYVIAIINDCYEIQYFDKQTMIFLSDMVYKGKLFCKKKNKGIDDENVVQLDLHGQNLGSANIKYIADFDLKNLRILDLSNNSIKSEGVFNLCKGKFNSLESLNLSSNKIGDEGLNHLSKVIFISLNKLYLSCNNISSEGIKYLVKAKFINNLNILDLSENQKIGDIGIRNMKEHKRWENLNILNLDYTGLTDLGLNYLVEISKPKLKKLNIQGNKFTENGNNFINTLKSNNIEVVHKIDSELQKEKKK